MLESIRNNCIFAESNQQQIVFEMKRAISKEFMEALLHGELAPVLELVKKDDSLDLEMRGKKIIIYYQGLKLFSITEMTEKTERTEKDFRNESVLSESFRNILQKRYSRLQKRQKRQNEQKKEISVMCLNFLKASVIN